MRISMILTNIKRGKKQRQTKERRIAAAVCAALFIIAASLIPTGEALGAQERTVKVGFFPMDGFNEIDSDGNYGGMDVEYLDALCNYTSWEIEYVECESWDDALRMLADKEIDLVGSAQYSQARAEIYDYASLSSGYTFGSIAVRADSGVAYEDFDAMSALTYGTVATYIRQEEFYEYMADNGVHKPNVIEYESTAAMYEAFEAGEVDAVVHSLTEIKDGLRIVGRFAPMPIYYITYKGNSDLLREMNQAIADIKMNAPELENELIAKYYDSRLDQTVLLTTQERQYISEKGTLSIGCLDGYYPFSYEEDGECSGLSVQVLDVATAATGLDVEYVMFGTLDEAVEALNSGDIDVLGYYGEGKETIEQRGISLTKAYAQAPHVIIMKKNAKLDSISTIAAVQGESKSEIAATVGDENVEVLRYDTLYDCLYAVKKGDVDAALSDGYLAQYFLSSKASLSSLEIHSVLNDSYSIYMAVNSEDKTLLSVLNKELFDVTDKMVSDYMLQDNFYSAVTLESFLKNNSIAIILGLVAVGIIIVWVLVHMLRGSLRIQKLMYKDAELDIWNLNYLKYKAKAKIASGKKEKHAVAYIDVCRFREYKTVYGQVAGHRVLELLVSILSERLDRNTELYARNQSDHFVLFILYEDIDELMKRLFALEECISGRIYDATGNHMAIVMGLYEMPIGSDDLDDAIACAMLAADSLRDSRVNGIKLYDRKLGEEIKEMHAREKLLDSADTNRDFVAFYQAKVDIRNERVVGAEALVRFKDPSANGAIRSPYFFVPYYEKTTRIMEIDFFVMESVCKMLRRRMDAGKRVVPVSCNFSRLHFMGDGFFEHFMEIMDKYQIPKELLEVEITETLVVENMQENHIKDNIAKLRANGVRLSIDDFGSGYSSLGVFEQIPASVIKLDR